MIQCANVFSKRYRKRDHRTIACERSNVNRAVSANSHSTVGRDTPGEHHIDLIKYALEKDRRRRRATRGGGAPPCEQDPDHT